jgi:hypothetical protein
MDNETDSPQAGESLTIDQAAAAYSKAIAPKEVQQDQSEAAEQDDSDTTTDDELQDGDEPESDETDGETTDEDQAEDGEDTDEPESDQGRFVSDNAKVKLPDGSVTTIAELKQGSLRNADYTRKTQEVAEQRKSFESQSAALKASEEQLNQQREYVASLVKSIIGTPPDPTLADPNSPNYDPAKYQAEEVRFRSWAQHLTYLESEQQRTQQERQAETEKQTKERVEKEWAAALEKLPELKDQKKLETFGRKTLKYGAEYGYTPQELATIHHDHRYLLVMKDAIAWRELQASKATVAKKVEGRPPVQKGGKRLNPGEHRARVASDAIALAQKSGRLEDVAAAYHATRKGN